jgi:hypothetical protein
MTDLEDRLPAALRQLGGRAGHAEHLAADIRRASRRRRLLVAGPAAAVLAVCALVSIVWVSAVRPSHSTAMDVGSTGATSACRPLSTGPLPAWARAGFSGDGAGVHWTLSATGNVAAIVFAYPLVAPQAQDGRNNKILWVVREASGAVSTSDAVPAGPTTAGTDRTIIGHLEGTQLTAAVDAGPGPSIVDMPRPGCWHLDLPTSWAGGVDSVDLEWTAPGG